MRPSLRQVLLVAYFLCGLPLLTFAQVTDPIANKTGEESPSEKKVLSQEITNPISTLSEVVLQNVFIPSTHEAEGYANQLSVQATLAFTIDNFPDQILQLTIPALVTTPDGTNGFGDLELLEVSVLASGNWGAWGLGPAFSFPSATREQTGAGKWQAGVTTALAVLSLPDIQIGFIAYNLISFAGDGSRDDVNTLFFEPVFIYHFTDVWYFGWGDMSIEFNWENGGAVNFPVNIQVGRLFEFEAFALDIQLEPFWFPIHDGQNPKWGFQVGLIFPLPAI